MRRYKTKLSNKKYYKIELNTTVWIIPAMDVSDAVENLWISIESTDRSKYTKEQLKDLLKETKL